MTDKMMEGFENCSLHDGYGDDRRLEENRTWFVAGWQAAQAEQSVPVVNQCDGCCRGLTVDDDGVHRSENGFPVMVCERPLYVAAELERLRKDAERYRWIRDANNDPGGVIDIIPQPMALYRAESELDNAIDAAIAAEGEKE